MRWFEHKKLFTQSKQEDKQEDKQGNHQDNHQGHKAPPFRLVQITDCHLLSTDDGYHGIDSTAYLRQVLSHLSTMSLDCVVVTGDITQDHTDGSYQILRDLCRVYLSDTPVAWLPGNHDELDCLYNHYNQPPFISEKHLQLGDWHILLLNSKGPTPAGVVTDTHLAELKTVLEQLEPEQPVAVFCHHHLLAMNGYIDKHIMSNGQDLLALLKDYGEVKCISHGHVHQAKETLIKRAEHDDIRLWATPATSMQFAVNNNDGGIDDKGPAFRYFELGNDGQVLSEVVWLKQIRQVK